MMFTEIFIVYKWEKKKYIVGEQDLSLQYFRSIGTFKKLKKALKLMRYILKHGSGCKVPERMIYSRRERKEQKKLGQEYKRLIELSETSRRG